jgi:lipopolysaccharide/colanic/teichoic acid biosynthesis glycosyltransferase
MKRFFDFVVAVVALLVLGLPLLFLIWRVGRKLGSPVFFRQTRPGRHGQPFEMIKFRSGSAHSLWALLARHQSG